MRKEFEPNDLNDTGTTKLIMMRSGYSRLLDTIERVAPNASRERSLATTHLQESSHWAARAVAIDSLNQANVPASQIPVGLPKPPPTEDALQELARDFYACYCADSDGLNFQGNPCPQWDDLPPAIRAHWGIVAKRAYALTAALIGEVPMHIPDGYEFFTDNPDASAEVAQHQRKIAVWRSYAGK